MSSSSSMVGSSLIGVAWQEIRPSSPTDRTTGDIYLSMAVSSDGISWTMHPQFFGPIHYTGVTEGSEPRVYSMTMDERDRILVAVAATDREVVILESTDQGRSFRQTQRIPSRASIGAPTLFFGQRGRIPPPAFPGIDDGGPGCRLRHSRFQPFTRRPQVVRPRVLRVRGRRHRQPPAPACPCNPAGRGLRRVRGACGTHGADEHVAVVHQEKRGRRSDLGPGTAPDVRKHSVRGQGCFRLRPAGFRQRAAPACGPGRPARARVGTLPVRNDPAPDLVGAPGCTGVARRGAGNRRRRLALTVRPCPAAPGTGVRALRGRLQGDFPHHPFAEGPYLAVAAPAEYRRLECRFPARGAVQRLPVHFLGEPGIVRRAFLARRASAAHLGRRTDREAGGLYTWSAREQGHGDRSMERSPAAGPLPASGNTAIAGHTATG